MPDNNYYADVGHEQRKWRGQGPGPLDAVKSLFNRQPKPQPTTVPNPEPMATPPGAPKVFAQTPELGMPNIRQDMSDTVSNDDPYTGIKIGMGLDIDPSTTPSVLAGLKAAGGMDDPAGKAFLLQDKLKDEIEHNLGRGYTQAQRLPGDRATYGFGTGAIPDDLSHIQRDIARNPVEQYQGQKLDEANREYEARLGGFPSPQAAAGFGQQLETAKATAPVQAEIERAKGAIGLEQEKQRGWEDFANKSSIAQFLGMPGATIQGPGGFRLSTAQFSPGASQEAAKEVARLESQLQALQRPFAPFGIPLQVPDANRAARIADVKAQLEEAKGRLHGMSGGAGPSAAPSSTPSGSLTPSERQMLINAGPGTHKLEDGSVWRVHGDNSIEQVQ